LWFGPVKFFYFGALSLAKGACMIGGGYLVFSSFQLDPVKKRLWQGKKEVKLRPMAVAVLQALIEHAGKVIPKEDLLKQVWAGTYVTKTALKVCIREIRQALRDEVTAPRYIETVGQEGYRFVGHMDAGKPNRTSASIQAEVEPVVGREQDMARLQQWLAEAKRGVRQCVFLTGEAGVGKTTLVDLFLARLRPDGCTRVGYGQCVEQYGEGEAYLSVLEAVGRLCREPGSAQLIALVRRYAPTWLVQMPSLLEEAELASLQQNVHGMTRQRMLREIAEAIEALTAEHLLVLVLHDLQWSDYSTLELISYLAQRRERARLMIVGTYRPTDIAPGHPLKGIHQELQAHRQCKELLVNLLTESEVATYLVKRFPSHPAPKGRTPWKCRGRGSRQW
jgi:DNA-binding winged helix-turn-helix (wHTH) protein